MKDSDYKKLIELANVGGGFIPANDNAKELLNRTHKGEVITLNEVTQRDLSFHKCYFALLSFIYEYLPESFKDTISKDKFYIFVKHLEGNYEVVFKFKDGSEMVEYNSISFGRMSQKQFETFVANQLPFIYSNVLGAYFEIDMLNGIIETIESEFQRMLNKLP
jgi:hypothetical protein